MLIFCALLWWHLDLHLVSNHFLFQVRRSWNTSKNSKKNIFVNIVDLFLYSCRIAGFQDIWPKLEKWFSGKENVFVKVNAYADEEAVFTKVEKILRDTMNATEKGKCSLLTLINSYPCSASHASLVDLVGNNFLSSALDSLFYWTLPDEVHGSGEVI